MGSKEEEGSSCLFLPQIICLHVKQCETCDIPNDVHSTHCCNGKLSYLSFCLQVPPTLSVPKGRSPMVAREADTVELQCLVSGKPKPIILWSRYDKEKEKELPMPDGSMQMETYDGLLRIVNVSRDMNGIYKCQTSQYNGFNVKPREAAVQLIVQCK